VKDVNEAKPLLIQRYRASILNGPAIGVAPHWAVKLDSLPQGVVFSQLAYLCDLDGKGKPVRIPYSRLWKRHFPFYARESVIRMIAKIEKAGLIEVVRGKRVNVFRLPAELKAPKIGKYQTKMMLVHPYLAQAVGVFNALILQQVHVRTYAEQHNGWITKSLTDWHSTVFPFVSLSTVKRHFASLLNKELLECELQDDEPKRWRVNYTKLSAAAGLPLSLEKEPNLPPKWKAKKQHVEPKAPNTISIGGNTGETAHAGITKPIFLVKMQKALEAANVATLGAKGVAHEQEQGGVHSPFAEKMKQNEEPAKASALASNAGAPDHKSVSSEPLPGSANHT
jgi:hypothetical protein